RYMPPPSAAANCSAEYLLLFLDPPTHLFAQVLKAAPTNPPLLLACVGNISRLFDTGQLCLHKLLPTHGAVVMVPGLTWGHVVLPVESGPTQIVLIAEPPIELQAAVLARGNEQRRLDLIFVRCLDELIALRTALPTRVAHEGGACQGRGLNRRTPKFSCRP